MHVREDIQEIELRELIPSGTVLLTQLCPLLSVTTTAPPTAIQVVEVRQTTEFKLGVMEGILSKLQL
jgi:hypothetical protein